MKQTTIKKSIKLTKKQIREYRKSLKATINHFANICDGGDAEYLATFSVLFGVPMDTARGYDAEGLLHIFSLNGAKREIKAKYPYIQNDETTGLTFCRFVRKYYTKDGKDVKTYYEAAVETDMLNVVTLAADNASANYTDICNCKKVRRDIPQYNVVIGKVYENKTDKEANLEGMYEVRKNTNGEWIRK